MSKRHFNPESLPAIPGFPAVVEDDEWVFVAGTGPIDNQLQLTSTDFREQCEQTFDYILECLAHTACGASDIVQMQVCYVPGDTSADKDFQTFVAAKQEKLGAASPAGIFLQVAGLFLPGQRIEVMVTAKR